jgi:hypothetical protein
VVPGAHTPWNKLTAVIHQEKEGPVGWNRVQRDSYDPFQQLRHCSAPRELPRETIDQPQEPVRGNRWNFGRTGLVPLEQRAHNQ